MQKPKLKAGKTLWSVLLTDEHVYKTRVDVLSVALKHDALARKAVPNYFLRFNGECFTTTDQDRLREGPGVTSCFWGPAYVIDLYVAPNGYQSLEHYQGKYFRSEKAANRYYAEAVKHLEEVKKYVESQITFLTTP